MRKLNLSNKNLNPSDAFLVAAIVKSNAGLNALDISGNRLKVQGGAAICKGLTGNLGMNTILVGLAHDPAEIPVRQIRRNILEELDLTQKTFPPEGMLILAALLDANTSINKLSLSGDNLGVPEQQELIAILQSKTHIVTVDYDGSAFPMGTDPLKELRGVVT